MEKFIPWIIFRYVLPWCWVFSGVSFEKVLLRISIIFWEAASLPSLFGVGS